MTSENEMLAESLIVLSKKYAILQEKFNHLVSNKDQPNRQLKKRKADNEDSVVMVNRGNGNSEISSSDDDSIKRPKESTKYEIRRVFFRVEASDASLVSPFK